MKEVRCLGPRQTVKRAGRFRSVRWQLIGSCPRPDGSAMGLLEVVGLILLATAIAGGLSVVVVWVAVRRVRRDGRGHGKPSVGV